MKIQCQKEILSQALGSICRIIPARTPMPILSGCLMFTQDQFLILKGTDLDQSLTLKIPAVVVEEGSTVVSARYFADIVRRLPDGNLEIGLEENSQQLKIDYHRATVQINTWPADEYPSIQAGPVEKSIIFKADEWRRYIQKVLFAAASQELRPNYAGVCFIMQQNKAHLVATDTYRMALMMVSTDEDFKEAASLFIPAGALGEVNKLIESEEELKILWGENSVNFQTDKFTLSTRLMDAKFPAYQKVIPESAEIEVEIDKIALEKCLERAALFVGPSEHFAITEVIVKDDSFIITAQAAQIGSLREEISARIIKGETALISFNTRFFLDPLKVIEKEKVVLCLNGAGGPALYKDEDGKESYIHMVLPVCRLNEPES